MSMITMMIMTRETLKINAYYQPHFPRVVSVKSVDDLVQQRVVERNVIPQTDCLQLIKTKKTKVVSNKMKVNRK